MYRSTQSLESDLYSSAPLRRTALVRSSIILPPDLRSIRQSQVLPAPLADVDRRGETPGPARLASYGCLSVLQFLVDNPIIPHHGLTLRSSQPVSGRGRTYEVRRYSEGNKEQIDGSNYWRPSEAHKYLVSSTSASAGRDAAVSPNTFKSLINELRILSHKPLATHPNLLRITSVCWALSDFDHDYALPVIRTEFSVLGTLHTFVRAWECPYRVKRQLLLDVATGLAALHSCSIVHGDIKAENVLMFLDQHPECPYIAKISDFGFSVDVGNCVPGNRGHLVGYTPMYAAPEASKEMLFSEMHRTDIYSLGFVIWTVVTNGRGLFEVLDEIPVDPVSRYEAFRFLKETDDMDAAATRHILKSNNVEECGPDLDVAELIELSRLSLRLRPQDRDLESVRAVLLPGQLRKIPIPHQQAFTSKLSPYNPERVYMDCGQLLSIDRGPLLYHIRSDLEAIACSVKSLNGAMFGDKEPDDPTLAWRFPSKFCSRSAGAAYALFCMFYHGYKAEQSLVEAARWLRISAENGFTLAIAMCAKLNHRFGIGLSPQLEHDWLVLSAQNGSKPAMSTLRTKDPLGYIQAISHYKTRFWALCHGLSNDFISQLHSFNPHTFLTDKDPSSAFTEMHDNLVHCAALVGSETLAKYCLDAGSVDIDAVNLRGETAFFLSCKSGHPKIVNLLLSRGANPRVCNQFGENALHWLESFEDEDVAMYTADFIRRGLDIHAQSRLDETFMDGTAREYLHRYVPGTPLHRAVAAGNPLVAAVLIHHGADPSYGTTGYTPLCHALRNHDQPLIRQLFDYPMSKGVNDALPASSGDVVWTFFSRVIRPQSRCMLLQYIHEDYHDVDTRRSILKDLVNRGARLTAGTCDALYISIARRDRTAAEFLLSHGYGKLSLQTPLSSTRATHMSASPLALATIQLDAPMAEVLLRHGADPESAMIWLAGTSTPEAIPALHLLLKNAWGPEALSFAKLLVSAGANVNSVLPHDPRDIPLARALSQSFFDMASFLISQGARMDPPTPGHHHPRVTGLALLAVNNILDRSLHAIYEFLISHPEADIPLWVRVNAETVFHSLFKTKEIYRRNIDADNIAAIFRVLKRRFPERETLLIRDIRGWTALHHAVFNANLVGVKLLLEAGCDPKAEIRRERERVWEFARSWVTAREDEVTVQETYEMAWEELESNEGMSAVIMAREGVFEEVPLPVRDDPEEMEESLGRRKEIHHLLVGWEV